MSYSHDNDEHRDWVLALATRLRSNGVDVCLDRWDVTLGGNLARFMERTADNSYRVITVISDVYAHKADEREGGTGFEAQMLSARLYQNLGTNQVVPLIRNNSANPPLLPAFLGGRLWLDFRDASIEEESYEKLLRELYQVPIEVAPPLGPNPFEGRNATDAGLAIRNSPSRWCNPGLTGDIEFVFTQNSGNHTIGSGQCQFTLNVSTRGADSVYVYRDPSNIQHVALIEGVKGRESLLGDVSQLDTSSRTVEAGIGDVIILHNNDGYWAAVYVSSIWEREALNRERVIRFRYTIQSDRTPDLSESSAFLLSEIRGKSD